MIAESETGFESTSELRLMWRNTRMVVLCAISAALYAAVLVPFKVVPLIPGVTELRPANAIPIVCSFLFGPAAAWGSAIGNMIGDFFGGVSPGDIFGFFANLVYGWIPYKVWQVIGRGESPVARTPSAILKYVIACLAASVLCADLVGWGDNLLVIRPFAMLGNVIIFNNMASALLLAPFILAAVYPRVKKGRMLYEDMMPEVKRRPMAIRIVGFSMLIAGETGAWLFGNLLSAGLWMPTFLPAAMMVAPYDKPIAIIVSPFILLAFAGLFLM
ncbi:MAG: QueT transporter family protein [Candidatus Binatus sp.]|uniref:QueT transporter family protein n=1 Tax=Candidatus Binatus sp. TaxID=2811406 RepID=UPI002721D1AE|nr:QueT transporter family protein [Candidatus Binatus sp.]MDO8431449.1 QueT transporter family protein [Candidatus Binatus sp.]